MSEKFKRLKFNVFNIEPGEDLILRFADLGSLPSYAQYKNADRNKVIRYIMYFFDPNSELKDEITDHRKRQEAAAEYAEFQRNPKTGKFQDHIYEMFEMKNETVNEMIFDFLRIVDDKTWTIIKVNEINFWELARLITDPVEGKDSQKILAAADTKKKLREELKSIAADLDQSYKKLLGDSDELKEIAKKKIRRITPENVLQG